MKRNLPPIPAPTAEVYWKFMKRARKSGGKSTRGNLREKTKRRVLEKLLRLGIK